MKFITFSPPKEDYPRVGILSDGHIYALPNEDKNHSTMKTLLSEGEERWADLNNRINNNLEVSCNYEEAKIYAPLLEPPSLRDFYAFEQHVATANKNRGRSVPSAWYEVPVFYFSNPNSVYGHNENVPIPRYTQALDFELEIACIIGKPGINITPENALDHIFGFTIFNDWSARDVQKQEMSVGLGPAKGKDFASSFGPYIITKDELEDKSDGRPGVYDLEMVARINDQEVSRGNWKDLYYSFGDMIQRASEETYLRPGDIIGSGTVGTGCLLEITKSEGPWLKQGDIIELEVERLGLLRNQII